jgi:hypothetical protein
MTTARSASGDILLTYFMTIYDSDSVTNLKGRNINTSKSQRRQRANQTIRLLTTQRDSLNISLIGVHIARTLGAIGHYTKQIVIQTEVQGQLTIYGEVDYNFFFIRIQTNTNGIAETICQQHLVCVGMFTNILQLSYISTVCHFPLSFLIKN